MLEQNLTRNLNLTTETPASSSSSRSKNKSDNPNQNCNYNNTYSNTLLKNNNNNNNLIDKNFSNNNNHSNIFNSNTNLIIDNDKILDTNDFDSNLKFNSLIFNNSSNNLDKTNSCDINDSSDNINNFNNNYNKYNDKSSYNQSKTVTSHTSLLTHLHPITNTTTTTPILPPAANSTTTQVHDERRELFIPGFMKINNDTNLNCLAYSILRMVLPSFTRTDIIKVRLAQSKASITNNQEIGNLSPSFIITLKNSELVQLIMRTKRNLNYLTTRDLDLSSLNSEVATALPDKRIFINEVLSSSDRNIYTAIKETAQRLGFKFIWHSSGDFLVRWGKKSKAHIIRSVTDLNIIYQSLGYSQYPHDTNINTQQKHNTPAESTSAPNNSK